MFVTEIPQKKNMFVTEIPQKKKKNRPLDEILAPNHKRAHGRPEAFVDAEGDRLAVPH